MSVEGEVAEMLERGRELREEHGRKPARSKKPQGTG